MSDGVEAFRASLKRCLASPDFLRHFYHLFLGSSPEVRAKFEHTDFERQSRILADSLFMMAVVAQAPAEPQESSAALREMSRLGRLHSRERLDVRPGLYDLWLHCLLEAARRHDPEFSPALEEDWRTTLGVGIQHLRAAYE